MDLEFGRVVAELHLDDAPYNRKLSQLTERGIPDLEIGLKFDRDKAKQSLDQLARELDCLSVEICFDTTQAQRELAQLTKDRHVVIKSVVDMASLNNEIAAAQATIQAASLQLQSDINATIQAKVDASGIEQTLSSFRSSATDIGKDIAKEVGKAKVGARGRGLFSGLFGGVPLGIGQQIGFNIANQVRRELKKDLGFDLANNPITSFFAKGISAPVKFVFNNEELRDRAKEVSSVIVQRFDDAFFLVGDALVAGIRSKENILEDMLKSITDKGDFGTLFSGLKSDAEIASASLLRTFEAGRLLFTGIKPFGDILSGIRKRAIERKGVPQVLERSTEILDNPAKQDIANNIKEGVTDVFITIGGFAGKKGKSGSGVKRLISKDVDKDTSQIFPASNAFNDIGGPKPEFALQKAILDYTNELKKTDKLAAESHS